MRELDLGGLRARILGGAEGRAAPDGTTVVLLHGFGAPGDDLVPLAHYLGLPASTQFVFPEAPVVLPGLFGDLRAWWQIDVVRLERALDQGPVNDPDVLDPAGMVGARERVVAFLDDLEEECGIGSGGLVLGGFSQGAMVALDVSLHDTRPLSGLALMSCTLLAEAEWRALASARRGLRAFLSHGRADPLLSVARARALRGLLEEGGLDIEWREFDGGHDIPAEVQRALGAHLRATVASSARAR